MPPSPVVSVFDPWKLNALKVPKCGFRRSRPGITG
jgi:hypothetical protein